MYKPLNKLVLWDLGSHSSVAVQAVNQSWIGTLSYVIHNYSDLFNAVNNVFAFNLLQVKNKLRGSYILVCAPANAACDLLAQKLIPHCTTDELLRLHSSSRDW